MHKYAITPPLLIDPPNIGGIRQLKCMHSIASICTKILQNIGLGKFTVI